MVNNGRGCKGGGTPYSPQTMANMSGGARKKRGTGKKRSHSKKAKRGGGIISTAAAPAALYGLARVAHRRKRHSKNRTRRRTMRGGNPENNNKPQTYSEKLDELSAKLSSGEISPEAFDSDKAYLRKKHQKGGSVLGNALPSLVLYGLARGMRGTKKNSNHNGNKTRKMRSKSRRGRRM